MMERGTDLTASEFGKYEAYNLWLAYPQLHNDYSDIFNAITKGEYNEIGKYINFITKNSKDDKRCYTVIPEMPLIT